MRPLLILRTNGGAAAGVRQRFVEVALLLGFGLIGGSPLWLLQQHLLSSLSPEQQTDGAQQHKRRPS